MWKLFFKPNGVCEWRTPEGAVAQKCGSMHEAITYITRMEELLGTNIDWWVERM